MEIWEDISLHVVKTETTLIAHKQYSEEAINGIKNIFSVHFNFDMKIRELPQWLAEGIAYALEKNEKQCIDNIKDLNNWLNSEYLKNRNDSIRLSIE
jgi:hypothetical protein